METPPSQQREKLLWLGSSGIFVSLSVFILMDVVLMFQFLFSVFLLVFASLNIYYPPSVSPLNLPALRAWEMGHDERQRKDSSLPLCWNSRSRAIKSCYLPPLFSLSSPFTGLSNNTVTTIDAKDFVFSTFFVSWSRPLITAGFILNMADVTRVNSLCDYTDLSNVKCVAIRDKDRENLLVILQLFL